MYSTVCAKVNALCEEFICQCNLNNFGFIMLTV